MSQTTYTLLLVSLVSTKFFTLQGILSMNLKINLSKLGTPKPDLFNSD